MTMTFDHPEATLLIGDESFEVLDLTVQRDVVDVTSFDDADRRSMIAGPSRFGITVHGFVRTDDFDAMRLVYADGEVALLCTSVSLSGAVGALMTTRIVACETTVPAVRRPQVARKPQSQAQDVGRRALSFKAL